MNKLAIFVEGQTEQLFIEKLINKIFGEKHISIIKQDRRGRKGSRSFLQLKAKSSLADIKYSILIVNCNTDVQVKSDILEQHESLSSAGYQKIIGIRDVYPTIKYGEIDRLRKGLNASLPVTTVPIIFILGIMEIEAWFLAEYTHFAKISPEITVDRIREELGIDVIKDNLSQREHPAKDLSEIYWLEKIAYNKSYEIVKKVLNALDYERMKSVVSAKFVDLNNLYYEFESFFGKG